jgi:hypothetical protein
MLVLIDYDNVHELYKQRGLPDLAQRIADSIGYGTLQNWTRLRIRLYGGWFEELATTKRAQSLAAELGGFPVKVSVSDGVRSHQLIASAEFAMSLIPEPKVVLTHTFRPRGGRGSLACRATPLPGCINLPACPLRELPTFLNRGECPAHGCFVLADSILWRAEQKLVDTHLITDLLHLAHSSQDPIVLVSNDDDMWPGVRLALLRGVPVIHIHPVPGRQTPTHYIVALPKGYTQATLN